MVRSIMLLGDQDLGAAQSGLMDTLALNPNQIEAYIALIHIALAQKNIPEARRLLRLVERVNPDNEHVLVAKGSVLQAEGDLDGALRHFTRASEINPSNPLALGGLGTLYLGKNMPAFAEQALKRAVAAAPGNVGVLRALCQSQLSQQLLPEAEQTVSAIIRLDAGDASAYQLRSQLRQALQDPEGALDDARAFYRSRPEDVDALAGLCTLLIKTGRRDEAGDLIEAALAVRPDADALWQLRSGFAFAVGADGKSVIDSWILQVPNSALAHEALAVNLEATGDLDAAAVAVDKALTLSENLPLAQFVKLRQEIRGNPELALARVERLAQRANNPESQRMILAWFGMVYDRLGQYDKAAEAFLQMAKFVLPNKTLPTPSPAIDVPDTGVQGRLLWAPAGMRVERLLNVLATELGPRLLADRNQPSPAREDGFGPVRANPGSPDAGSALRWKSGILALGMQPESVVDWMPYWDAYTAAALRGTELTAVLIDPRDALLNWMVFGSAQSYVFPPNVKQSAKWLAASYHAIADTLANGPQPVHLVRMDDLAGGADLVSVQLQQALGLDNPPDALELTRPVPALGGMLNQFPAGHWRNYRAGFDEAFAVLTPAAVRLGYPEA
jgi:tetratricopeptide (TPR) repeat protein